MLNNIIASTGGFILCFYSCLCCDETVVIFTVVKLKKGNEKALLYRNLNGSHNERLCINNDFAPL